MSFLNEVKLIGNLGADPEVRTFSNGGKVASLRLATTRKWKDRDSGQDREETEWHSVQVGGDGLVRVVEQYTRKGSKLFVSGRLRTRKWQDQNGHDRYSTEILVSGYDGQIILLGDPRGQGGDGGGRNGAPGGGQAGGRGGQGQGGGGRSDLDDDIPF